MLVDYIAQPDTQLGKLLSDLLDAEQAPSRIVFVSAFVSLQTTMRVKRYVLDLKDRKTQVRLVLGIDLGGTSYDVLKELLEWGVDISIVKHRNPRHTFHPKLYLFEWADHATIIIGSNNITEGGFFGNYEGAVCITYALPAESAVFEEARAKLARFLQPEGNTVLELSQKLLGQLADRGEIRSEADTRQGGDAAAESRGSSSKEDESLFGMEDFPPPPPLPPEFLKRLLKGVRTRRAAARKAARKRKPKGKPSAVAPVDKKAPDSLAAAAFYMTLPKLQGHNIPGEGRVPLEAIELAKQFWGWPAEYTKDVNPHAVHTRVYWNWRPYWRIWSVETPEKIAIQQVRMYMYENSSDFRFYARQLVNAGADLGDVVRIRRIAHGDAEYECVLARRGTPKYDQWIKFCTETVRNSTRRFGYA